MILILKPNTATEELNQLKMFLSSAGFDSYFTHEGNVCVVPKMDERSTLTGFSCIEKVIPVNTPYQLSSLAYKSETSFKVNGVMMGSEYANIIAGPCSVESEEQIFEIAEFLNKNQVRFIRGGAYKPRTSPYSFRGLGKTGLAYLSKAAKQYDLNVVTELMDLSLLDEVLEYTDIIQVGSRNMANFYMLNELGKVNKPVLLKRGMQAKISEWLLAADYIMAGGNENVILCERGIRSFDPQSRNVMDVAAIPLVKSLSHLPVIADPSHGTGTAKLVPALAKASMVAGANGLMIEIHPNPEKALSDANQALSFTEFENLLAEIESLKPAINKPFDAIYSLAR